MFVMNYCRLHDAHYFLSGVFLLRISVGSEMFTLNQLIHSTKGVKLHVDILSLTTLFDTYAPRCVYLDTASTHTSTTLVMV